MEKCSRAQSDSYYCAELCRGATRQVNATLTARIMLECAGLFDTDCIQLEELKTIADVKGDDSSQEMNSLLQLVNLLLKNKYAFGGNTGKGPTTTFQETSIASRQNRPMQYSFLL